MYNIQTLFPIGSNDLIRLGRKRDGGYVVNANALQSTKHLLSFGISTEWSFERDFLQKNKGVILHAFDFSVSQKIFIQKSVEHLGNMLTQNGKFFKNFLLFGYYIWATIKFTIFFRKKHTIFYQKGIAHEHNGVFVDFLYIFNQVIPKSVENDGVFVKMDIEGDEFSVLKDMLDYNAYICSFVVEFHDLDTNGKPFEDLIKYIFDCGYSVSHIHANNGGGYINNTKLPRLLEITFIKSHLVNTSPNENRHYPIPSLDYPCVKNLPEIPIFFE